MLQGERVVLRAIERGDLSQLLAWRNEPWMRRFYREYRELSMAQQESWYENVVLRDDRVIMWSIVDRADGRLLGACGLCYVDWVSRNGDLSIYIGADGRYIDEEYAPDAARVALRYGFEVLGLHRVWAEVYAYDTQKSAFFESLGFSLDGRHREAHWDGDSFHDSLFFGLLRREWRG